MKTFINVAIAGLILVAAAQTAVCVAQVGVDKPSQYLKGVNVMSYHGFTEGNQGRCAIDWPAMQTEMSFVANQSTKLKLITDIEHSKQLSVGWANHGICNALA